MNRLISRLILVFVPVSLAATVVPLLQSGSGRPLVPFLDRGDSLALYAGFLVVFLLFLLPGFMSRDEQTERCLPWAVVTALVLLFAAIPLVFTAYISGVSVRGLMPVAALCAAAAGLPLLLRRWLPRQALVLTLCLGSLACFVLPGLLLYQESVGLSTSPALQTWSVLHWLHRIAAHKEVPLLWPFLLLAGLPWVLALLPRRSLPGRPIASALLLLWLPASLGGPSFQGLEDVSVKSLAGGTFRPGFRLPLRVRMAPSEGPATIRIGGWATRVPADGAPHDILGLPGPDDRQVELQLGAARRVLPLPASPLVAGQVLVAVLGDARLADQVRAPARKIILLRAGQLPLQPGALEMFHAVLMTARSFQAQGERQRASLERYGALGGQLILLDDSLSAARQESLGLGTRLSLPATLLADLTISNLGSRQHWALDTALIKTFASPRWEEMDLSALLLFALVYHLAFLLAFLLPLLIDSRKSVLVYLVSVGFVVLVVTGLAYQVLTHIFLKENQVYTQSVSLLVQSDEPRARLVGRQFLCFASMSEETRDLQLEGGLDLIPYRPLKGPGGLVLDPGEDAIRLRSVTLDRRQRKTVVRVDRVGPSPLRLRTSQNSRAAWTLEPVPGVADPWGLLSAVFEDAVLVEGGRWSRHLRAEGLRLIPDGVPNLLPQGREELLRKLLGRFAPPFKRYLLLRCHGVRRPDSSSIYLEVRDLGAWMILPLPPG